MTILYPAAFNASLPAGFDGLFHWEFLEPAFKRATGRDIRPMDIDAHVEISGHHLVFETKDVGVPVPEAQVRALLQLWAKGYHTVIFLWGKQDPIRAKIYWPAGLKKEIWEGQLTKDRLAAICERWAKWADSKPRPFQYVDCLA